MSANFAVTHFLFPTAGMVALVIGVKLNTRTPDNRLYQCSDGSWRQLTAIEQEMRHRERGNRFLIVVALLCGMALMYTVL